MTPALSIYADTPARPSGQLVRRPLADRTAPSPPPTTTSHLRLETAAIDTWSRFGGGASASMRGTYALQGARMVSAWLGLFPASVIK